MKTMKKWMTASLVAALLLTGCTSEQPPAPSAQSATPQSSQPAAAPQQPAAVAPGAASPTASTSAAIPAAVDKPLKIALVSEFSIGTFSAQYLQGVKEQVSKFGGELVVYNADGDLGKMAAHLDTAVNQKVDGILINHGRAEAL